MSRFLARLTNVGGDVFVVEQLQRPTDPGFGRPGGGWEPVDPGYGGGHPRPDRPDQGLPGYGHPDQGLPGHGHPGNALPTPPVRPSQPIALPPGMWPPHLPPGANVPGNELPPEQPIFIPPDPDLGIEQPIYLPSLPAGVALLIALPQAAPKEGTPPNTKPAILVQSGKKPVLVYVSAAATPK